MLESAGYIVRLAEDGDPSDAHLWVTEPTEQNLQMTRRGQIPVGYDKLAVFAEIGVYHVPQRAEDVRTDPYRVAALGTSRNFYIKL